MSRHKYIQQRLKEGDWVDPDSVYDADLYADDYGTEQQTYNDWCQQCQQNKIGYSDESGTFYCNPCWDAYYGTNTASNAPQQQSTQPQSGAGGSGKKRRKKRNKKTQNSGNAPQNASNQPSNQPSTQPKAVNDTQPKAQTTHNQPQTQPSATVNATADAPTIVPTNAPESGLLSNRPNLLGFGADTNDTTTDNTGVKSTSDRPNLFDMGQTTDATTVASSNNDTSTAMSGLQISANIEEEKTSTVETNTDIPMAPKPAKKNRRSKKKSNQDRFEIRFRGMRLRPEKEYIKKKEERIQLLKERLQSEKQGAKKKKNSNNKGTKPHLNLVVVGHVDHGKSTLMGHLLYALGNVANRDMHKYRKEAQNMGKGSFAYAWVLDCHTEERMRGVTTDVSVNYFETQNRRITLLDSPGHRDFIPKMISGAAQADCAVLVASAVPNEFAAGFTKNGQTREHGVLIRSLGVTQVIVAVNKMDLVQWDKSKFDDVRHQLLPFLKELGFQDKKISFVPVSGLEGHNLSKECEVKELRSWYGNGPNLVDLIDRFKPPSSLREKCMDSPLRITITDAYKDDNQGGQPALSGKVLSGCLIATEQILIQPSGVLTIVRQITNSRHILQKIAIAGDNVELLVNIKDDEDWSSIHTGDVICFPHNAERPILPSHKFQCKLVTMADLKIPICKGHSVMVFLQSLSMPAIVKKLHYLLDKASGQPLQSEKKRVLRHIKAKESAVVTFEMKEGYKLCLDPYDTVKALGRVTIRREGDTIAVGQVMEVSP